MFIYELEHNIFQLLQLNLVFLKPGSSFYCKLLFSSIVLLIVLLSPGPKTCHAEGKSHRKWLVWLCLNFSLECSVKCNDYSILRAYVWRWTTLSCLSFLRMQCYLGKCWPTYTNTNNMACVMCRRVNVHLRPKITHHTHGTHAQSVWCVGHNACLPAQKSQAHLRVIELLT